MNDSMSESDKVKLEKMRFGLMTRISQEMLVSEVSAEYVANDLLLKVKGFVWGRKVKVYRFYYPRDWWESFKDRWFPAWFKKRYPVIFIEQKVDVNELYPNLKLGVIRGEECIVQLQHTSSSGPFMDIDK